MKKMKENKAITLVALIITIVVLLILVGIVITQLTNSGLLNKSNKANLEHKKVQYYEEINIAINEENVERQLQNKQEPYITGLANKLSPTNKDWIISTTKCFEEDGEIQETNNDNENNLIIIITKEQYEILVYVDNSEQIAKIDENSFKPKMERKTAYKISKNESILGKIDSIKQSGIQNIEVNGKTYSANVVYVDRDLVLNSSGTGIESIQNLTFEDGTYTVGNANTDCAKSKETTDMAKNMVVLKVDGDLTIDQNVMLTACKNADGYGGPKGLLIYCNGTLKNRGTISMTARGAYAEGEDVFLWQNTDGIYEFIPKNGALGANGVWANRNGNTGNSAATNSRKTGGGGSGQANWGDCGYSSYSGNGASGTSYSGGPGGGGVSANKYSNVYGNSGAENGGAGGLGVGLRYSTGWAVRNAAGGAGNPGGTAGQDGTGNVKTNQAENGTGGLLIIFADTLINETTGIIESNGCKGGEYGRAAGGSSGGGSINIFYTSEIVEQGQIQTDGGEKVGGGSLGGTGSITIGSITDGNFSGHTIIEGDKDLYGIIQDSGREIGDYGITCNRAGRSEGGLDQLYKLGQSSGTGINSIKFTLTIDFDKLSKCVGTFSKIRAKYSQYASTSNGYTSWMQGKMIVYYTDETTTEMSTEKTTARNVTLTEEYDLEIPFNNKNVSKIEMILEGYDSDYGGCSGYIKNIDLIP